ncbi:hypothetical protein GYMLUDRAFT_225393 [Collybiopsis luxurians FD-317 M1]|uniref:Polyketide synthase n=1 Tax=Collybiopsis luxurians FD-317 M1 TaxID=944289 RepID=A0A0D0BZ80_9AGAR|nr:hypothetical protein GYMLUDRAFT_225393 [Collybiopsis luxurians FD-317 M1]
MGAHRQIPMAIVGIAAQLPSGNFSENDLNYETFWDFLVNRGQAFEDIPISKASAGDFPNKHAYDELPAQGAFLKRLFEFDHISLGISKRDAKVMPPAARRLLELSFIAMQDSGIECSGRSIGCFMSGNNDLEDQDMMNTEGSFAYVPSAMANRISYLLNICGPSIFLDTACSSSLTALHLAINAIESGDCPAALVGACQSNRRLTDWRNYAQAGVLSPDGTCKPFDASADGFVRAEGAAVIVIKSLQQAIVDNDRIYSVILGSAINSTGSNLPLNVPNGVAQQQCIRTAYDRAGRDMSECDYLELHATGTAVGDPIEANAAGEILGRSDDLVIGSVKGNIGHLEANAFLVSLVKACLIFKNRVIPPTVNVDSLNPSIHWDAFHLKVAQDSTPLRNRSSTSIISVSSSGIGGSTGHVVLESPPSLSFDAFERWIPSAERPILCVVGGLSPAAVRHIAEATLALPHEDEQSLFDAAVHLSRRARQLPWRTFFTMPLSSAETIPKPIFAPRVAPSLAFVFSGQGPQNLQMGRQLFEDFPVFRESVLEMDEIYRQIAGCSLLESTGLFRSDSPTIQLPSGGWPVAITLPALAILHIALFDLLKSVGVTPDAMLGHSAGETAIVYASGAGSKAMAMEIAYARGRAMTPTEAMDGGMVAMGCGPAQASAFISEIMKTHHSDGTLCISCFNAPDSVAVTGPNVLLERIVAMAKVNGIFAQKIKTLVPGHSDFMESESCRSLYHTQMEDIFSRYKGPFIPKIPVYSTCTGLPLVDEFTPDYFWQNARNPVLFSDGVSRILALPSEHVFVEISPHPVLKSSVVACGAPQDSVICPMQRRSGKNPLNEHYVLSQALGQLACFGINSLDLAPLYGSPRSNCPPSLLHPLESRNIPANRVYSTSSHVKLYSSPLMLPNLQISRQSHPMLAEHIINGAPILPATAFIEMLLELGARTLWDIDFHNIIPVASSQPPFINLEREGEVAWSLHSSISLEQNGSSPRSQKLHASGCMDNTASPAIQDLDLPSLWNSLTPLGLEDFYQSMKSFADFGPHFRRVLHCHGSYQEAIAEIRGLEIEEREQQFIIHPAMLDACLHFMLHDDIIGQSNQGIMFVPVKLESFILHDRDSSIHGNWYSHAVFKNWSPEQIVYDITVANGAGKPICSFKNLTLQKQYLAPFYNAPKSYDYVFQPLSTRLAIPPLVSTFDNSDRRDSRCLNEVLDSIALQLIQNTLTKEPKVGNELHRRRYHDFTLEALNRKMIPHSSPEIEALQKKWPAYFEVSERLASVHTSVFESSSSVVTALYSDGLMSEFYGPNNLLKPVCEEAAAAFEVLISHYLQQGKKFLRVLEVGAGTGMLTRRLVPVIQKFQDSTIVEYTVTDISSSLASDLVQTIPYEPMVAKPYDLSKGFAEQDLSEQTFDIVVALHTLHAVSDIEPCLQNLNSLLVPGGALLVAELDGTSWNNTPGSLWLDCVFGSFAEWFGYTDDRTHCAMSPTQWEQKLSKSGFTHTTTSIEAGGGLDFLFIAQRPSLACISASNSRSGVLPDLTITYELGQEIQLQQQLKTLDPTQHSRVQLIALDDIQAGAAIGLIPTLTRELPSWEFRLAIFKSVDHFAHHEEILPSLADIYASGEDVILIADDGRPWVPKVVPIASLDVDAFATLSTSLNPAKSDKADEDFVEVSIISCSEVTSVVEFVGSVIDPGNSGLDKGQLVVGITSSIHSTGPMGESLLVHAGCISAPSTLETSLTVGGITGTALAGLALGTSFLSHPERVKSPLAILVDLSDTRLAAIMIHIFSSIPKLAQATAYNDLSRTSSERFDLVLSDTISSHEHPHARQTLHRLGRLILVDELVQSCIKNNSWEIRDALDSIQKFIPIVAGFDGLPVYRINVPGISDALIPTNSTHISALFDPTKSYLLVGGIGGLGLEIAIWMYKNGAKYLVLTSRRGISSLKYNRHNLASAKLAYLMSREDLQLSFEACDATDILAMKNLIQSIPSEHPIGGCFLMPLHLSDALFFNQKEESIRSVMDSKLKAFETLATAVDLDSVDFTVTLSSVAGLFGNIGQSNYSSACSAMNWAIRPIKNSFSLIVPGILDAGYLAQAFSDRVDGKELQEWSISAEELCRCIEDGIRKLRLGRDFKQYIPDLKWTAIEKHMGSLPPSCRHLTSTTEKFSCDDIDTASLATDQRPLEVLLSLLDVSSAEFDPSLPLTTYGLDSIGAAKIAAALRPYGPISQMQLLGGSSWDTLQEPLTAHSNSVTPSSGFKDGIGMEVSAAVKAAFNIVLKVLDLQAHEFDAENPLVAYGLDSISAARLSRMLQPFVKVPQMQLLGTTSWANLKKMIENGRVVSRNRLGATDDKALTGPAFGDTTEAALGIVLKTLDIPAPDFDPENPLVAYGLDSISAARLSRALRPYVQVTQMQLLGQTTWADLVKRISNGRQDNSVSQRKLTDSKTKYRREAIQSDSPIVELQNGERAPLIILHDITGSIEPILALINNSRLNSNSTIWAIRVTSTTPLDSVDALTSYYYTKIKERRPTGPYRLAAYSASSIIGAALARRFEEEAEKEGNRELQVSQLVFIDHFPTFWICRLHETLWSSLFQNSERVQVTPQVVMIGIQSIIDMLRRDNARDGRVQADRLRLAEELSTVIESTSNSRGRISDSTYRMVETFSSLTTMILSFLGDQGSVEVAESKLIKLVEGIRAPMTVIVASHGMVELVPEDTRKDWMDLGASLCVGTNSRINVARVEGGHFGLFENEEITRLLELM